MYIDNPSLFSGSLSGSISLSQAKFEDSLIPKDDNNINLGSPSKRFSKIYVAEVSSSTISGLTTSSIPDFDTHVSSAAADAGFGSGGGASIPSGTVSGSQQIEDLGFITSSADGTISSSLQVISALPNGTISSSAQITDGSDIFSGSLVAGTNITINQVGDNFEISSSAAGDSIPSGTVSGSQQIEDLGFISGSLVAGTNITINQVGGDFEISSSAAGDSIPSGTISGSQQIEDLGFITSSAGTIDTGSFYVSSSISGDTIKFTQGDNTTETVTIETVNTSSGVINPNTNELIKIWIGSLADYNAFRVTGATTSNPSSATSVTFTVSSSSIFTLNGRVFVTGTSPGNTTKTEGVISSIPDSTTVVISFPTPYTSASTSGYTLSIHDPNILYFVR